MNNCGQLEHVVLLGYLVLQGSSVAGNIVESKHEVLFVPDSVRLDLNVKYFFRLNNFVTYLVRQNLFWILS